MCPPEKGSTRVITGEQRGTLFAYRNWTEAERPKHPIAPPSVGLQSEFAYAFRRPCGCRERGLSYLTAAWSGRTERPARCPSP